MRTTRMRLLLSATIVAAMLAGCDSPEERAESHYERGVELLESEGWSKARLEFQNALRLDPRHVGASRAMAEFFESEGNARRAARFYLTVADADPQDVDARIRLARIMLASGQFGDARAYAEEASALAPESGEAKALEAAARYRLGEEDAALALAEEAIAADPDLIDAHFILISDLIAKGRDQEARARVDALLATKPDDPQLNLVKLQFLERAGDDAGIEAHLRDMVARFPEQMTFRGLLAQIYARGGETEKAEAELRAMAGVAPDNPEPVLALVRYIYAIRGEEAAREELRTRIASGDGPVKLELRFALAEMENRLGRVDEARAILEDMIATAAAPEDADRARIGLARLDIAAGDQAAASERVETVLERDSENVGALALRATLQIESYEIDDAIATIRTALDLEPQNVGLLLLEARAQEQNGNSVLVGERLGAAVRVSEFRPDVALRYATFLRGRDQLQSAETVLSESARRNPSNRDVLTSLAEVRLQLGDLVGAEQVSEQLRSIEGADEVADRVFAATLAQQGRLDDSITVLERAVGDNGNQNALAALVAGYVRTGDPERAVTLLDDLLETDPGNLRALLLRAELHILQGDEDSAEALLRRMIEAAPQNPIGYTVLTRFLLQRDRADDAMEIIQSGAEAAPEAREIRFTLASMYESKNDFDAAIAEYQFLYDLDPNSLVVANNLASLIAEHHEDDAEAMALAERIARRMRSTEVPHLQDTYGWIAFLRGDQNEALRALTSAADQLPDNALVRYHFGRALAAADQIDKARVELEAALALDPDFPKAQSAREVLATLGPAGGG